MGSNSKKTFHTDDEDSLISSDDISDIENFDAATSTAAESVTSGGGSQGKDDEHAPEALVRKETQVVKFVRSLVILILIGATAATSYSVYNVTNRSEREAFDGAFASVAEKLTNTLISDTSLKVRGM